MQLTKITLRNFRSFKEAEITDLGAWNVFFGFNGVGKSTILDAITFGLTGTCRGAETGRSLVELRTTGSPRRLAVELEWKGAPGITRLESDGPRSAAQDAVRKVLSVPPAAVRACLESGELLRLDRKEAQRLILDLAATKPVEIPAEVKAQLAAVGMGRVPFGTLEELRALHKQLYETRRVVGRTREALPKSTAPPAPEWLHPGPKEAIPDAIKALQLKTAKLKEERDGLYRAWVNTEEAWKAWKLQATTHAAKLADAEAQLGQLRTREDLELEKSDTELAIKTLTDENEKIQLEIQATQATRAFAREQIKALGEEQRSYEALGDKCRLCRQPISKAKTAKLLADLTASIQAREEQIRECDAKLLELDQATKPVDELVQLYEQLDAQLRARATCEAILAAQEPLEAEPPRAPKPDLSDLARRIEIGETRIGQLTVYWHELGNAEERDRQRAALEDEYKTLDTLVAYFGPEGVQKAIAESDATAALTTRLKAALVPMGFDCDLGPLLRLEDDPTVNGRPARLLSHSEQIRFGFAFSLAVATVSGLGMVAVDGWEALDWHAAAAAIDVLAGAKVQAFIFLTPHNNDAVNELIGTMPIGDGFRIFQVSKSDGVSDVTPMGFE